MKICSKCDTEKRNKDFYVNNSRSDNLSKFCKECDSAYRKKLRSINPEIYKKQWKRNKYSSPELSENRRLLNAYGISKITRDYMASIVNNSCEICHKNIKLVVDHDHKTGVVRGLLCAKCNRGLGHFDDNIDLLTKAVEYIRLKTEQNNTEFTG